MLGWKYVFFFYIDSAFYLFIFIYLHFIYIILNKQLI